MTVSCVDVCTNCSHLSVDSDWRNLCKAGVIRSRSCNRCHWPCTGAWVVCV